MASSNSTSIITIGQGRRITLAELYVISSSATSSILQFHETTTTTASTDTNNHEVTSAKENKNNNENDVNLSSLVIDDLAVSVPTTSESIPGPDECFSFEEMRSFLTILAFQLVQTEGNHSVAVHKLVHLINHHHTALTSSSERLSRISIDQSTNYMQQWIPELSPFTDRKSVV